MLRFGPVCCMCISSKPAPPVILGSMAMSKLTMYHSNCQILLYRPKSIETQSPAELEGDAIARFAADSTTRIAEDLLASGTLNLGQLHLCEPPFFN